MPGVDADVEGQFPDIVAQLLQRGLHLAMHIERHHQGADGVVLMTDRSAEKG